MNTPNAPAKPIRSPSYPNMALSDAVVAVAKIEKLYRSAPVDRASAAKLIGYTTLSGPANKALAALAAYGLFDRAGKGEARVTERARDILHADSDEQRKARLREAALEPSLFRELRERFAGIPVPPEDGVVTYLNRQGFNPNAVRPAAKAFLATMSYLEELGANDSHGDGEGEGADSHQPGDVVYGGAAVGDLVQWEANGSLKLPGPRRVRAVSDDGDWVFVEQSETGIPMSEIIVQEKASGATKQPPTLPLTEMPPPKGTRKEVITLDEGDVTITFPTDLSSESFGDLKGALDLFIKKMQRRASPLNSPKARAEMKTALE